MKPDEAQKRREEARRAMSGGSLDDHEQKYEKVNKEAKTKARLAMSGPEKIKKEIENKKILEEKRVEARRQMEGYERRRERELEEYKKREALKIKEQLEKKRREREGKSEKELKKQEEERARQLEEKKSYQERLTASLATIDKIKGGKPVEIKSYHTLQTDVSETLKNKELTAFDLAQQSSQEKQKRGGVEKSNAKLVAGLFLILIIVSFGGLYTIWVLTKNFGPVLVQEKVPSLIITEETKIINTDNKEPEEVILEIRNILSEKVGRSGAIKNIVFQETIIEDEAPTKKFLEAERTFQKIGLNIPQGFSLSLRPEYMMGFYLSEDKNLPFYIFSLKSYEQNFDSLLKNENQIISELLRPFEISLPQSSQSFFKDRFISNINVRESFIEPTIFYAFPNKNTLIISLDQNNLLQLIEAVRTINIAE